MPTIEEARVEIEKAKVSLEESKATKVQREQEAQKVTSQLEEARKKIPNILSQRSLRQRFAGLEGRRQRQAIQKVIEDVETRKEDIEKYKQDLSQFGEDIKTYETTVLKPYEQEINLTQQQIDEYNADVEAFTQAQKFYQDRVPLSFVEGKEHKYLKQMYASGTAYDEYVAKTEKEVYGKLSAVNAGITTFDTAFPKDYLDRLKKSGITITREQSSDLQSIIPRLPRDVKKDIPKVPEFIVKGIDFVSAQLSSPAEPMSYAQPSDLIRTAESSIKYVPVIPEKKLSLVQRGLEFLRRDVKIPIFIGTGGGIPVREVTGFIEKEGGVAGRTVSLFIPKTYGEAVLFTGVGALGAGAGVVGKGVRTGVGVLGGLTAISPEALPEERIAGGIMAFGGGIRPVIKGGLPKEITLFTREPQTTFTEVQRPLSWFGRETTLSRYAIKSELTPPRVVIRDTGQGFLFAKPEYIPAKTIITKTPFTVVGKELVTTLTSRGEVSIVSGVNVPTSVSEFRTLPREQQYLWQQYVREKTGVKVKLEDVPKVLKEVEEVSRTRGFLEAESVGQFRKRPERFELFGKAIEGKSIRRYQTISAFEKVKETEGYDVFKGDIFFKDVTFPLARARGKTPSMSGTIFRIKEPIVIGEEPIGIKIFRPSGGRKTQLSSFQEQVLETPKPIPKAPRRKGKTIKTEETSQEYGGDIGLVSGGVSGYGSGFIVQSDIFVPSDFGRGFQNVLFGKTTPETRATEFFETRTETGQGFQFGLSQSEVGRQLDLLKTKPSQREIEILRTRPETAVMEIARVREEEKSVLKFFERLAEKTKQTQKEREKIVKVFDFKPRPRIPPPTIRTLTKPKKKGVRTVKEALEDFYSVFVRKGGKDISIGEFGELGKAKKELFGELRKSLRASGFVEKGGKPIKLNVFGTEFQPSKRDFFRVVQPKRKRLSAKTEVREIQFLRGSRKRNLWGF